MGELNKQHEKKLKWFKDRIGKRVFRDKNTFDSDTCIEVFENGLIIIDEMHAHYLTDISLELGINYYDEKPIKKQ